MKYGDVKTWLLNELNNDLERIINAKQARRDPYWILIQFMSGPQRKAVGNAGNGEKTVNLEGQRVVHHRMTLLPECPKLPYVDSALVKVDNRTGEVCFVYILPPDRPCIQGFEVTGEQPQYSEAVYNCSKHVVLQ